MSMDVLYLSQEDVVAAGVFDMSLAVPTMEEVIKLHQLKDYILHNK